MKIRMPKKRDLIFLVVIVLLIIPQTRKPIQVTLNKVISQFGPSIIDKSNRTALEFSSFKLVSADGEEINLKDLQGEVILLNFWATWCPPCIAELPHIQDLANDYNNKIKIILVSGENQRKVSTFFEKKGYVLDSYKPLEAYPSSLNVSSIPRTLLLDKEGNIVIDKVGPANWNSDKVRDLIDDLLN